VPFLFHKYGLPFLFWQRRCLPFPRTHYGWALASHSSPNFTSTHGKVSFPLPWIVAPLHCFQLASTRFLSVLASSPPSLPESRSLIVPFPLLLWITLASGHLLAICRDLEVRTPLPPAYMSHHIGSTLSPTRNMPGAPRKVRSFFRTLVSVWIGKSFH